MHFLKNWTPWRFEQETEMDENKGTMKITGVKTVFHKSFYKWRNLTYNIKDNRWESFRPEVETLPNK